MTKNSLIAYLRPTAEDAALADAIRAYPAGRSSAAYVAAVADTADVAPARPARARRSRVILPRPVAA